MYLADKIYQKFPTPDNENMWQLLLSLKQNKASKSKLGKLKLHFENKKL